MSKAAALCTAFAAASLALGDPAAFASTARAQRADAHASITDISAATVVRTAPARVNVVRTPARVNVTPQFHPARTTTQTQFRKLGGTGGGTGGGSSGGPKFHKTGGPGNQFVAPANVHLSPNKLQVTPNKLQVGPGKLNVSPAALKPAKIPFIKIGNKVAPVWKGPKQIWWGGKWKKFIPFGAIGVVLVGGSYFYPDGYLGLARPYCEGITPDGCRLNWQMVNFEDGGGDWQCVQFCPRPGVMPPPQAVALVAPPPVPQGSCQVTIFAEPNFAGNGVPTSEEQPALSQAGWQNQIASIQVQSGVWDFYTDENFTGETMRLPPGPYPTLGPEWTKRIGSFMCTQPGS